MALAPGVRLEPTPPMADRTVLLDDDRALQRRVRALVVVVVAAGAGGVEVTRLAALAGCQESDLIDLGAIPVRGMGVRAHVVRSAVVVHERDA